jgi:hypothetical protein
MTIIEIPTKNSIKKLIKNEVHDQTAKEIDRLGQYIDNLMKEIDRLREEIKIMRINQKI